MSRSVWEDYYFRYRVLLHDWECPGLPRVVEQQELRNILCSPSSPRIPLKTIRRYGSAGPSSEHWEEALELRGVIRTLPDGWFADEPLADVYQAALRMETYEPWHGDQFKYRMYRGQRDHRWRVIPALYRDKGGAAAGAGGGSDVRSKLDRVCAYARFLQAGHDLTEEEAVAVVTHYSQDIGAATWLIDHSWDPFVALFFASDGGVTGDIGVVSYIGFDDWELLSAGGTNRLGGLRMVEPRDVPRIKAQRALFLDTSHPDLIEQYVAETLYFRQRTGLVFEDDQSRDTPVSRAVLYPKDDPYKEELLKAQPPSPAKPLAFRPVYDTRTPLRADDYLGIVESWCRHDGSELDTASRELASGVCRVFAAMQTPEAKPRIEITARSLSRLEEVLGRVRNGDAGSLEEACAPFINRLRDPAGQALIAEIVRKTKSG